MRLRFGETITVVRPAERDDVGDRTGAATTFEVEECAIAWQSSRVGESSVFEDTDRRETATLRGNLFVPRTADIRMTDYVLAGGTKFRIVGPPQWDQNHPMSGWNPGYKVFRIEAVI